jgi:hypothetical protein
MNEELAELPCEARLLFIGLWTIADREGRLEDRPRKIKAALFPYDQSDVDDLLRQLARKGFLRRYEAEGGRYIHITNFKKHQNPHPKEAPSDIPVLVENEAEPPENLEKDEASHEKDRSCHENNRASHENHGISREKVLPGHGIPDSSKHRPGSGTERNGNVREEQLMNKM